MPKLSSQEIFKGQFVVSNDRGLHTRPSTELVKCAAKYRSDIFLIYKKDRVNAKSLLGVLMLAACKGAKIKVEATGNDAVDAINGLVTLASHNFYADY